MHTPRGSRRWPALLVVGAVLAGCSGFASARAPWTAAEPASRSIGIPPVDAAAARARAEAIRTRLGLPGRATATQRIEDRLENLVVDQVTFSDANGPSAIVELEPDGRPHVIIALGWRGANAPAASRNLVLRRALAHVKAAGIEVSGLPTIIETVDGWEVVWERQVDGIPVLGDGVRLSLWKDGSFHAIAAWEHALAPRPTTTIDEATARAIAANRFGQWSGGDGAIAVRSARLAFVRPNDAVDPNRPDAPLAEARLAWVVTGEPVHPDQRLVKKAEIWLDAGDGSVIGGDLVE